jgi:hypothetical protein
MLIAFCVAMPGCTASPQAQLDRAEALYGSTVSTLNIAYQNGAISPKTQLEVISPARKTARDALDAAKAAFKAGSPSWKILLDAANQALEDLQKYTTPGATTRPAGAIPPPVPPQQAVVPVALAIALLQLIETLAPIAGKLLRGEELTDDERALAEKHSADADAQADANDADARAKLG